MSPRQHFGRYGIALLALVLTAAGAPAMTCGAMADCPMLAAADDCHETSGEAHGCAPEQVEAGDDCCCVMAAQPVSAPPSEASAPSVAAAAPGPAAPPPATTGADRPVPARQPPNPRAAGRALLSLQQTFLI
jgi:hypothetical protein